MTKDLATKLAVAIGLRLRRARIEACLTLKEVGAAADTPSTVIARTESGKHQPQLGPLILHALAVGLGPLAIGVVVDDVLAELGVEARARTAEDRLLPRRASARRRKEAAEILDAWRAS